MLWVSPMPNMLEVQDAIWVVQQPVYRPPVVECICIRCKQPLSEHEQESDLAFCRGCLNMFKPKQNDPLVISVEGRSTLNDFIELQLWKTMDIHMRMNEPGFERFLVILLEEKMKAVVRKEMWKKHPGKGMHPHF